MKKLIIALIAMMTWSGYAQAENKISFCFDPWPPVHELEGNGEPEGLFIDIVKVIFEKNLKMEVEYLQLPWKRCQSYVHRYLHISGVLHQQDTTMLFMAKK